MPTDVYRPRADVPRMPAAYKIEGDSNTVYTRIRTRPVLSACTHVGEVMLALPVCDKCQPNSCWVWQSITSAMLSDPSFPPHTQHRSVAHRRQLILIQQRRRKLPKVAGIIKRIASICSYQSRMA